MATNHPVVDGGLTPQEIMLVSMFDPGDFVAQYEVVYWARAFGAHGIAYLRPAVKKFYDLADMAVFIIACKHQQRYIETVSL